MKPEDGRLSYFTSLCRSKVLKPVTEYFEAGPVNN